MRRATIIHHGGETEQIFQSTLSMRRATGFSATISADLRISIHALHEESDLILIGFFSLYVISIHALHEESD